MNESLIKPSRFKEVIKLVENESYEFKKFLNKGNFPLRFLFKNTFSQKEIVAKLVAEPSSGELHNWPGLSQDNLNSLLDVKNVGPDLFIFISPYYSKTLRDIITSDVFLHHPKSFQRKLFYVKGILKGLEYLHHKSLCLLNLCDKNIAVHEQTDNAVICNFSSLSPIDKINLSKITLPKLRKPPEFILGCREIDGLAVDIWLCGIIFLQMFTRYILPSYNFGNNILNGLTIKRFCKANFGSNFDVLNLKDFLGVFLAEKPQNRISAHEALNSSFLNKTYVRIDKRARDYWLRYDIGKLNSAKQCDTKINSKFKKYPKKSKHQEGSTLKKSTVITNLSVLNYQTSKVKEHSSKIEELKSNIVDSMKNYFNLQSPSNDTYKYSQSDICNEESSILKTPSPNLLHPKECNSLNSNDRASKISSSSPKSDRETIKEVKSNIINSKTNYFNLQSPSSDIYKYSQSDLCSEESSILKTSSPSFLQSIKSNTSNSYDRASKISFSPPISDSKTIKETDNCGEISEKSFTGKKNSFNLDEIVSKRNQNNIMSLSKLSGENCFYWNEISDFCDNFKKHKTKNLSIESSKSKQSKIFVSSEKGMSSISYKEFEAKLSKSIRNSAEPEDKTKRFSPSKKIKESKNDIFTLSKNAKVKFFKGHDIYDSCNVNVSSKISEVQRSSSKSSSLNQSETYLVGEEGTSLVFYQEFDARTMQNSDESNRNIKCSNQKKLKKYRNDTPKEKEASSSRQCESFDPNDDCSITNKSEIKNQRNKTVNLNQSESYKANNNGAKSKSDKNFDGRCQKSLRYPSKLSGKIKYSNQKKLKENQNDVFRQSQEMTVDADDESSPLNKTVNPSNKVTSVKRHKMYASNEEGMNCKSYPEFDAMVKKSVQNSAGSTEIGRSYQMDLKENQNYTFKLLKKKEQQSNTLREAIDTYDENLNFIKSKVITPNITIPRSKQSSSDESSKESISSRSEVNSALKKTARNTDVSTRKLKFLSRKKLEEIPNDVFQLTENRKEKLITRSKIVDSCGESLYFSKPKIKNLSSKTSNSKQSRVFGSGKQQTSSILCKEFETGLEVIGHSEKPPKNLKQMIQTEQGENQNGVDKISSEIRGNFINESEIVDPYRRSLNLKNYKNQNMRKKSFNFYQTSNNTRNEKDQSSPFNKEFKDHLYVCALNSSDSTKESTCSNEKKLEASMFGSTWFIPKHTDFHSKDRKDISMSGNEKHLSRTAKDFSVIPPPFEVVITDCVELDGHKRNKNNLISNFKKCAKVKKFGKQLFCISKKAKNSESVCRATLKMD